MNVYYTYSLMYMYNKKKWSKNMKKQFVLIRTKCVQLHEKPQPHDENRTFYDSFIVRCAFTQFVITAWECSVWHVNDQPYQINLWKYQAIEGNITTTFFSQQNNRWKNRIK